MSISTIGGPLFIVDNYLSLLHPLFHQRWQGRNLLRLFSPGSKKAQNESALTYNAPSCNQLLRQDTEIIHDVKDDAGCRGEVFML